MIMRVNLFLADSISISCPNSKQSDLHKYNPIPVEALYVLPLYPVNDFSKTLGKSSAMIPIPLSSIINLTFFSNCLVEK